MILTFKGRWNAVTNIATLVNGTVVKDALQDGVGTVNDSYIVYADTSSVHANIYNRDLGSGLKSWIALSYIYYDGSVWAMVGGSGGGSTGTVTSVELSGGTAISISGTNPITTSGTITVTNTAPDQTVVLDSGVGISVTGTYPNFTVINTALGSAGGGGKTYYLNGSIPSGVVGYEQLSKIAVIGLGTDFSTSSNDYIASFLTDVGDPGLLNIPLGNWAFQLYMQASSPGGSPYFYIELYKYDGVSFTLISSSSANPEYITNGTSVDVYTTLLAVPATTLSITDRIAIRIYVNTAGRTITLHTEDTNLSQVITTFSTGISAINGLTAPVQIMTTGTTGINFNIASSGSTHTFNLPIATSGSTGKLTNTDWIRFNNIATSGITALTGDVTATGPGSVPATLATVATAGTYGSKTSIPVITIDSKGRTISVNDTVVPAIVLYLYNNLI